MSVIKVNNITSRDGTTGPVIAGITTVSSTSHLVVPTGSTGQRVALAPDPFINNLVLALPLNSESVFTDVSPKSKGDPSNAGIGTTTFSLPFGQTVGVGTTAIVAGIVTFSKYYGSSCLFTRESSCLIFVPNNDFEYSTGDFTFETWIYWIDTSQANSGGQRIFLQGVSGTTVISLQYDATNSRFESEITGGNNLYWPSSTLSANKWYHIAYTRRLGNTYEVFVDGTSLGTRTLNGISLTQNQICIGGLNWASGYSVRGYMQDVRVYKGVAKYVGVTTTSATFTPPNQIAL